MLVPAPACLGCPGVTILDEDCINSLVGAIQPDDLSLPPKASYPQALAHHLGLYFMASRGAVIASSLEEAGVGPVLSAISQGIDDQSEGRGGLPAARVVEVVARKGRRAPCQNLHQPAAGQVRFHLIKRQIC